MADGRPPRPVSAPERLNAVYGDDEATSALDKVLEALQFLSLPVDDRWDQPRNLQRKSNRRSGSSDPA